MRSGPKLDDANWAGTKKSDQCVLILTEGDSAKTMTASGLHPVVGRDKYGGLSSERVSCLNVRDASIKQITDNAEITNLKKTLGLESGKHYKDVESLRYGKGDDYDRSRSRWMSYQRGLGFEYVILCGARSIQLNYIASMITSDCQGKLKENSQIDL